MLVERISTIDHGIYGFGGGFTRIPYSWGTVKPVIDPELKTLPDPTLNQSPYGIYKLFVVCTATVREHSLITVITV